VITGKAEYPWEPVSVPMRLNSSPPTPNAPTIAEFLIMAMMTLPSGGTTLRSAWGMTTKRSDWVKVRPMERAASAWPGETELIPLRTASQTKAAV
jgi:hypothetical protein